MVSKIDKLVKYHADLKLKKQQVEDRANQRNSAIETKMKKLEDKAYNIKLEKDRKIAELNRLIKKTARDVESEREYVNSVPCLEEPEKEMPNFPECKRKVKNG